jgi:uncharacterized membrane-anchored protein
MKRKDTGLLHDTLSKVPAVTVVFWFIKICATTFGETGGDALSMTLNLGYFTSTLIFLAFFLIVLSIEIFSKKYHPINYWLVVIATTTVGTTTSDFFDRTLKMGYVKSSIILFFCVIAVLIVWKLTTGDIKFNRIIGKKNEAFYWFAILVSNTLGTALGDFTATSLGLGFERGALVFSGLLVVVGGLYFFTQIPASVLFWSAYVLTRPLGATLGDVLTKSFSEGGFHIDRFLATLIIGVVIVISVVLSSPEHFAKRKKED